MLQINNFHATVAGKPILNGLSLTVPAGVVSRPLVISLEGRVS